MSAACPLPANAHGRYPQPVPLPAALPWRAPVALALRLAAATEAAPAVPWVPTLTLHHRPRPGR